MVDIHPSRCHLWCPLRGRADLQKTYAVSALATFSPAVSLLATPYAAPVLMDTFARATHMTKSKLIEALSVRSNLPKKRAEGIVNAFFDTMADALMEDERIEVRGFGSFSVRRYEARMGRNPRTGDQVFVDEKKSVHFKVGKELRDRVSDT